MWGAVLKIASSFVKKDKLVYGIIAVPLAFLFLLVFLGSAGTVIKHVPLAEPDQYRYYMDAAEMIKAETGIDVDWQQIIAIDAVLLEQDFSKSSLERALSYKWYFVRQETVEVGCPADEKGGEEGGEPEKKCYETHYYGRPFDEVLSLLVSDGIIRPEQIPDIYDYLQFKISLDYTDDTGELFLSIQTNFQATERFFAWPLSSTTVRITSPFGMRLHPVTGVYSGHLGIDIAAEIGTPVFAIEEGVVIFSGYTTNGGNAVHIQHANDVVSKYLHLDSFLVRPGRMVSKKERIGSTGNTGRSTGPHLHFQIEVNGKPVNPISFY